MTIWAPGMRCVCIVEPSAAARALTPGSNWVAKGRIYTVREVRDDGFPDGFLRLLFEEVDNRHLIGEGFRDGFCYLEPGFPEYGFRPLSETRLDQFRKHLNRIPAGKVSA